MVSPADLKRAADLLRSGRLVAFPTETVYGLGGNALDERAVARIYAVKARPFTSPLIVHVDSIEMARSLVKEWPREAELLAQRFWPGALTLVLPKQPFIPAQVTAGLDTVGVRVPAHPIALALVKEAGIPIAAPSANKFTRLSPTSAEHVRQAFSNEVDMILDGGPCSVGIESTVLSLAGEPMLLRPGMISQIQLEEVVGSIKTAALQEGPHSSPGLHPTHYQPATPLYWGAPNREGRSAYIWRQTQGKATISVHMPGSPEEFAGRIYSVLHELDSKGLDYIAVEELPDDIAWSGIRDRLNRASRSRRI